MSDEALYTKFLPVLFDVEEGKTYPWCGCGHSNSQPLCDRTQVDCGAQCVDYYSSLTQTVAFCSCKQTLSPPYCDGSHAKVLRDYLQQRKNQQNNK